MHVLTEHITQLFSHYGDLALFFFLAFGIVGLPIPDETLLTFTGLLIAEHKMPLIFSFLAAYFGSIAGITISYLLGRTAGKFLIEKYGFIFGVTHKKIQRVHNWLERIGKWTFFFGYFVPGIRHLTGFVAGSTQVHFRIFALFAYFGALLWVTIFLALGYFFGASIFNLVQRIDRTIFIAVIIILVLFGLYYLFRRRRKK